MNIRKTIGWMFLIYSTYGILYGQFGLTRLRFTHTPFYYLSFPLLVFGILLINNNRSR